MDRIIEIIARTPLWLWPLLAALLWLGWQASQTHVVKLSRLVILLIAVLIMSIVTLLSFEPNGIGTSIWVGGVMIGSALGWFSHPSDGLAVDREHGLLKLLG
jgi:membrane associated rhomboid family serine protease